MLPIKMTTVHQMNCAKCPSCKKLRFLVATRKIVPLPHHPLKSQEIVVQYHHITKLQRIPTQNPLSACQILRLRTTRNNQLVPNGIAQQTCPALPKRLPPQTTTTMNPRPFSAPPVPGGAAMWSGRGLRLPLSRSSLRHASAGLHPTPSLAKGLSVGHRQPPPQRGATMTRPFLEGSPSLDQVRSRSRRGAYHYPMKTPTPTPTPTPTHPLIPWASGG